MRNPAFASMAASYLFADITREVELHQHPVDLGVGDTTLPLAPCVIDRLQKKAHLALRYGPEHGLFSLREALAKTLYPMLEPEEIFISDGVKTDIGRIHALFDSDIRIAFPNPTYPTYKEAALLAGKRNFSFFPCTPENQFFPDVLPQTDLLFLCSPSNPTGHTLTRDQWTTLIARAHREGFLILYDGAYSGFIRGASCRTPYELPGADEVVIELNSFSKLAGFTGLRLGWSIIPKAVRYPRSAQKVHPDWCRVLSTYTNGPSRLIQEGGLAALSQEGRAATEAQITHYITNTNKLKQGLAPYFSEIYGGDQIPYLWIRTSKQHFDDLGIITIPGVGFGSEGKGFVRLSGFSSTSHIEEALWRCSSSLALL